VLLDLSKEARVRPENRDRWILHGAVAATLGVMAEGLFEHNLGDSEVLTMFLATISCGYVVMWSSAERGLGQELSPQAIDAAACVS
jgi:hypothetical protein